MTPPKRQPVAPMFPAGDDTPLLSGTPVPITLPDMMQITAVDPGALEGDQSVLFVVDPTTFDPSAIGGNLSSGGWFVVEGRALIGGYAYQVKTTSPRGPIYPIALAVTPADAAVLAQAKHLLRLVVQAFGVPPKLIADPSWEAFRADARRVLEECAQLPKPE